MKRVIWLALFVCMVLSLWGKIRLPSILGDNMVLQRSDTVNIWGWAAPSQNVTVKPSWDNRIYTTKAENNGKLDKGKRLSFCKTSRFSIEENIKNYITLKKYGCRTL